MNQEIDINEINAMLTAVGAQRNLFADQVAVLQGKLAVANTKIADLENQLKKATEKETPNGQ